jgi:hypothetical protein
MYYLYVACKEFIKFFPRVEHRLNDAINTLNERVDFFINFYYFICENNPLILDLYNEPKQIENATEATDNPDDDKKEEKQIVLIKYEDKYLEKFKQFLNDFVFTDQEMREEKEEFEKIKIEMEKVRLDTINKCQDKLCEINEILEKGIAVATIDTNDQFVENINEFGKNELVKFFDLETDYEDEPDDIDFQSLYKEMLTTKVELDTVLKEAEEMKIVDEELLLKARDVIINKKMDQNMNNYILEHTPLGNIYMRYNNTKKSFEYFSNNTIPYRYLEPVGRKYVMTYWCKPIFVDLEDELKKAEMKYDEDKKNKEQKDLEQKNNSTNTHTNTTSVIAKLKSYNKDTTNQSKIIPQMKNRSSNYVLPPQIKANLPNLNQTSEKQLLKEHANRYTCEGRLTDFSPLKKIDKKMLNKKLNMTYADFKRMQQK